MLVVQMPLFPLAEKVVIRFLLEIPLETIVLSNSSMWICSCLALRNFFFDSQETINDCARFGQYELQPEPCSDGGNEFIRVGN